MVEHWLLPVDDSEICELALQWTIKELLEQGHEIHLLHVLPIPVPQVSESSISGGGDFVMTSPDPHSDQAQKDRAREFMQKRFLPLLQGKVKYHAEVVHFATDADSIGEVVCARADAISAKGIVLAKHNRGLVADFFLGSVTSYCSENARQAVIVFQ